MNWQDIKTFPHCDYRISVDWEYLLGTVDRYVNEYALDLNPDFQRSHVWTEEQQIRYVEYVLKEPQSGLDIYFNHPGWMTNFKGHFVLVDGKQRLNAAVRFLKNEIPAFGHFLKDIGGLPPRNDGSPNIPIRIQFYFNIARLKTREQVLQWYLDFNSGGTPHTASEIERVRELLEAEQATLKQTT